MPKTVLKEINLLTWIPDIEQVMQYRTCPRHVKGQITSVQFAACDAGTTLWFLRRGLVRQARVLKRDLLGQGTDRND